jgi:hypothetical protein
MSKLNSECYVPCPEVIQIGKDMAAVLVHLDGVRDDLTGIKKQLADRKSMDIRVDRLEQSEERRKWSVRLVWGAIVTLVATQIQGRFK